MLPGAVYPKRIVARRILSYLRDIGQGPESGIQHVYFGHTHRAVNGYVHRGVVFHNGGAPIGLVGYDGAEPVAWVSIAPKASHLRLGGPDPDPGRPGAVWSLACLYLKRRWRHAGHTSSMIAAAAAYARGEGALVLEAYPVRPDSPSFRYMGLVPTYEALGFRPIGPAGTRRTVMQLDLV